jgi:hypothetical protein
VGRGGGASGGVGGRGGILIGEGDTSFVICWSARSSGFYRVEALACSTVIDASRSTFIIMSTVAHKGGKQDDRMEEKRIFWGSARPL